MGILTASNTLECNLELIERDNQPIHSFDGRTFGKICCKKIETGWRIVDGNGKISVDLKYSIVRDTGYYMYCVFHNYNRVNKHCSCTIDAGILRCRNTCSAVEEKKCIVE